MKSHLPDRPKHLKPPQPQLTVAVPQIPQSQPQPQTSTTELKAVPSQAITIEDLGAWWQTVNHLGKPEPYKQRIAEIASQFKAGGQLSPKALAAMEQDTLTRISQVSQKLASNIGQLGNDGTVRVTGKIYDLALNFESKNLAIAHKNGEQFLVVKSGQVQVNKLTPEVLRDFEVANSKLDEILAKDRMQGIQR
ncbi:hypothetical protein NIES2109_57760 (plasmid) [Nostoc sp. HK-01]|nr:hypothetical protein NIES2109_57760 [Nostoc sp. HK-01]